MEGSRNAEITFGHWVRMTRERQSPSLSQRTAAERARRSEGWWRTAEKGTATFDDKNLIAIAFGLGLTPDEVYRQLGREVPEDAQQMYRRRVVAEAGILGETIELAALIGRTEAERLRPVLEMLRRIRNELT